METLTVKARASKAKASIVPDEFDSAILSHYVVTKNPIYKERAYEIAESSPGTLNEPEVLYHAVQKE
ncbi:MAG: hypothetical protein JST32_19840, partial [Bacteroidetes bacterium]|nr:hypothetical protein [Bacteroidota bacterium]